MIPTTLDISTIPRWALMWGLAVAIYSALKWWTWAHRSPGTAPVWQHLAYLFAWPGMDVDRFLRSHSKQFWNSARGEWMQAIGNSVLGVALLMTAAATADNLHWAIPGWIGMIGIAFTLHFGVFHILSCIWRHLGVDAEPLMNWPIASQGVAEFWGKRWNLAFRDLTYHYVFRPLLRTCGPTAALLVGFLISGIVHDLVISVPAGGGWGLPTCYFLIQGLGILIEKSRLGRSCGLSLGITGWLSCLAIVVLPCPLLFHPPFVRNVIVPFLKALGAF
jgi:hypothetical protein